MILQAQSLIPDKKKIASLEYAKLESHRIHVIKKKTGSETTERCLQLNSFKLIAASVVHFKLF